MPAKAKPKPPAKANAKKPAAAKPDKPWAGQRWAFFGELAVWPAYHGTSPEGLAARKGALITDTVDDRLDAIVFGDLKGTGRSEAKKKAEKLKNVKILDEAAYRELVRIDLAGKRFAFAGGFD